MLQERAAIPGALWTGKDIFGSIYQYMVRYMNRYRNSAFRVLLTLQPATDTSDTERRKLREEFRQRIRGALRGSDVMMECTDNQVFLLLPGIKEQDIERVIGRLLKRWKEAENNDHATISVEYGEIDVGRKTYRRE